MIYSNPLTALMALSRALYVKAIHGSENLPQAPFIIAANHPSGLDPVAILAFVPLMKKKIHFVATTRLFKGHFLANLRYWFFIKLYEGIPTNGATERIIKALKKKKVVALFPQGHVGYDREFWPAQTGAVVSALMAKVPIVPVGISGTDQIWPTYKTFITFQGFFRFKRIKVAIGKPIYLERYYGKPLKKELLNRLTKRLMKEIGILIKESKKL
jgi:1-acyl-sn-glycerol-3-phosphate acyltransferase